MDLDLFIKFLPFGWLENTLVAKTSAALEPENGHPLTLGELLRYIGIHLLMVTLQGGRDTSSGTTAALQGRKRMGLSIQSPELHDLQSFQAHHNVPRPHKCAASCLP